MLDSRHLFAFFVALIISKLIRVIQMLLAPVPEVDHEQYQAELEANIAELDRIIES
jgi:hypothetical protein